MKNKYLQNYLIIQLFIIVIIILYTIIQFKNINTKIQPSQQSIKQQSQFLFPGIDLDNFNFKGKCGTIFKYQSASSRDLILFSHKHTSQWKTNKKEILFSLSLIRKVLPQVSISILTFGQLPNDFIEICEIFQVKIIQSNEYSEWNPVNARIPMALKYLKEHENDFDRVAWSDLRDIYILNDIFSTIEMNEIVWMAECSSDTFCLKHTLHGIKRHFTWVLWFFGFKEAMKLTTIESTTLNGGFGIGGIKKMIQLLTIWNDHIEMKNIKQWGYDQTLLNWLFYNDYFKTIDITLDKCTQRMCFAPLLSINKKLKTFELKDVQCAPIVFHKDFPNEMKQLFIL